MRKNVFTGSIRFLIITLLLLAAFFQKEHSQKLMAFAIVLWLAITAGAFLLRKTGKPTRKRSTRTPRLRRAARTARASTERTVWEEPETEPSSPAKPAPDSRETETMLLHISLRITEKLKSAYPQSVWQWKDAPSLSQKALFAFCDVVDVLDTFCDTSFYTQGMPETQQSPAQSPKIPKQDYNALTS